MLSEDDQKPESKRTDEAKEKRLMAVGILLQTIAA
jgi:hypothetical protein